MVTIDDDQFFDIEAADERGKRRIQTAGMSRRMVEQGKAAQDGPRKFRIEVRGNPQCSLAFIFTATSHKGLQTWFNAIVANWTSGRAMTEECAKTLPQEMPAFWNKNRIRAEEMNRVADSGDIIFFSSKVFIASVQRLVTASEYDHTAMFLRFANG